MSKVINLFARRTVQVDAVVNPNVQLNPLNQAKDEDATAKANDLHAIAERNDAVRERMRKERADANKSVLRSYRIK